MSINKPPKALVDVHTGKEWVNADNMKQLIENMKSKNFYPEIIIEEIEKHLSDPTLLNKLFSVRKSHSPVPVKESEQEHDAKSWLKNEGYPNVMPMTLDNLEIILNRYVAQLKSKEGEQEDAVKFAEWIDGEDYECVVHTDEDVKVWQGYKGTYTTIQLYQLFKQSTTKPLK